MKATVAMFALGIAAWGPWAFGDAPAWVLRYREGFESGALKDAQLQPNSLAEKDPYSDDGAYFHRVRPGFQPPRAFRGSLDFGSDGWLRIERYSRNPKTTSQAQYSVVPDPAGGKNHVLRISSPDHTDGIVVRPAAPLPDEYRICVRARAGGFGDGKAGGTNGYRGSEQAEPWLGMHSTPENGLYWLAILDAEPRPRNNVWIHHHRKAVIDSDNNWYPEKDGGPWTRIFDGNGYVRSGEHPVMMFILDAGGKVKERSGLPFISWSANRWNVEAETGDIRAADAYLDGTWYDVCIEKTRTTFGLSMKGRFRYGGEANYSASIDRKRAHDPPGSPDYFMFGDPHANFYRGEAFYDDIRLYVR